MIRWLFLGLLSVTVAINLFGEEAFREEQESNKKCNEASYHSFLDYNGLHINSSFRHYMWQKYILCRKRGSSYTLNIYDLEFEISLPESNDPIYIVYKKFPKRKPVSTDSWMDSRKQQKPNYNPLNLAFKCYAGKNIIHLRSEISITDIIKDDQGDYYFIKVLERFHECAAEQSSLRANGICYLPVPLPRMSMLDHCFHVYYLRIDESTILDTTTAKFTAMKLEIVNSKLNHLNMIVENPLLAAGAAKLFTISFTEPFHYYARDWRPELYIMQEQFDFEGVYIIGNKQLCVPLSFEKHYSRLGGNFTLSTNANGRDDNCKVECTPSEASFSKTCTIITESIDATCTNAENNSPMGPLRLSGIGYNSVTFKGKKITLKGCSTSVINAYFEKVKNLQDVEMIVQDPIGNDISRINARIYRSPKTFEVTSSRKISLYEYASLKYNIETVQVVNKEEFPEGVCHFSGPTTTEVKGCKRIEGDLRLDNNSISVDPMLEEITGCIYMDNTSLPNYEFLNNIKNISMWCRWNDKPKGKEIINLYQSHQTSAIKTCILYEYRQNPLKLLDFINDPKHYANCGQQYCVFNSTVEGETKCKGFDGDLIVGGKTGEIASGVRFVRGCIHIVNSTLKSYEFLKTVEKFSEDCVHGDQTGLYKTAIANNTCIPYIDRKNIKNKTISDMVADKSNIAGCAECTGGNAESLVSGCAVVIGDLIVDKADEAKVGPKIASVREVIGRIVIKNNGAKKLSFTKLERIQSDDAQKPALEISDNKGLETIELPALKKIATTAKTKVEIMRNPNWKPSKTLEKKLKQLVGVCKGKKDSRCRFEEVKKEEKKKEEAEEEGLSGGAIAGIIIAVLLILILAGVGGGVVAFIIIRKKKKSKSGGANPKPGPPGPPGKGKATPAKTPTASASRSNTNVAKGASKPSNTALTSKASTDKLGPSASRSRENVGRTASREGITATKSKETVTPAKSKESVTPAKPPANKPPTNKPPVVKASANVKIGLPKPPAVNVKINVKKG